MRSASAGLIAFLLTKQPYFSADLFTFTLNDGSIHRWTSADRDVYDGVTLWYAQGPSINRTGWSIKNTLEIPEMTIKIIASNDDYSGANIKSLMHQGLLDGATVLLQRAFMPTWGDMSLGLVTLFSGRVSTLEIGAVESTLHVKSVSVILQQYMPRNQYQMSCIHTLYDTGCGANRAANTFSGVVGAYADPTLISWGTPRGGDGTRFALGTLTFTSGAAEGSVRTIQEADNNNMRVSYPLYQVPATGDSFTATYGCVKNQTACNQFGRIQSFRGFPFIPTVENAV